MATARKVVDDALMLCGAVGIGQSANSTLAEFTLQRLNDLSAQFALDELWISPSVQFQGNMVAGQTRYTVGSGGDIATTRPESIVSLAINIGGQYVPLEQLNNSDWDNRLRVISVGGDPAYFRYLATSPLGTLDVYPAPTDGNSYYLGANVQGAQYEFADDLGLPTAYESALRYSLAVLMGDSIGKDVAALRAQAEKMVARVKRGNDRPRVLVNEWTGASGNYEEVD